MQRKRWPRRSSSQVAWPSAVAAFVLAAALPCTRSDAKNHYRSRAPPSSPPSPPPGAFLTRAVADNRKQVTVPMPPQRRAVAASEAQPAWAEDAALVRGSRKV